MKAVKNTIGFLFVGLLMLLMPITLFRTLISSDNSDKIVLLLFAIFLVLLLNLILQYVLALKNKT